MIRALCRSFAGLAAVALTACAAPRAFTATDRTSIDTVLTAQVAAWNRGDLDGYMAGYARIDTLVFTSGGNVRQGWDDALAHYRARYGKDASTMGHLALTILSVQTIGADGAVVLGRWKLDGPNAAGGIFSVVFERRPEGWRIIHDHTSADAPAP